MHVPIPHADFAGRGLAVRPAGWTGARIVIDGTVVKGKRGRFRVRDNHGDEREIRLKANLLDPVPGCQIDGLDFSLAQPFTTLEYVWLGLPLLLVFGGGALGGACGMAAAFASARVFRSDAKPVAKYAISLLFSILGVVAFLAGVLLLQQLFPDVFERST